MPKPRKKRGPKPLQIAMTPQEAEAAIDRMLRKPSAQPPGDPPPADPAEAPRVRIKRPPKK